MNNKTKQLYDWILTENNIRGSYVGDKGHWISSSAKPVKYDINTGILLLENGMKYLIFKEDVCYVNGIMQNSLRVLNLLSKVE